MFAVGVGARKRLSPSAPKKKAVLFEEKYVLQNDSIHSVLSS